MLDEDSFAVFLVRNNSHLKGVRQLNSMRKENAPSSHRSKLSFSLSLKIAHLIFNVFTSSFLFLHFGNLLEESFSQMSL